MAVGFPPPLLQSSEIIDYVEKRTVRIKFRGETQIYLPRSDIDFLTSDATIRHVISKHNNSWLTPQEEKDLVEMVCQKGRKIFLAWVYADLSLTVLRGLLIHKLHDSMFPLKLEHCPAPDNGRNLLRFFIDGQAKFNAAFFELNKEQNLDNDMPKPIQLDESKVIGRGAFGEVIKVYIPESQRDFSSGADSKGEFAMKVTPHKGTREESFHRSMAGLDHHHLVKCLSSFVYSSKYYMIYEKADCNVEEFMKQNPDPSKLCDLTAADVAQQLYGLADGLRFVHNQGRGNSLLTVPVDGSQETAYLHDIKPENLLMFVFNINNVNTYWIRLSDFSCAKVVDLVASVSGQHKISWRTTGNKGTPIYRAPETSETGKSSRPYDLWSLGCVYLELLVWFLDGYQALMDFRESRDGFVKPGGREDEGFYHTRSAENDANYEIRPAVAKSMRDVSKRCTGPLKVIADTIPQLLQIKPNLRPTATELVKSLKHINTGAKPPIEISHSRLSKNWISPIPFDRTYSSDSDSDYDVIVNVQAPSSE